MNRSQRPSSRARGREYEKLAEKFLIEQGYTILERSWQTGHKEIDLIAKYDTTVVFVEVKSARSQKFGHPAEWIDRRKQQNIITAAEQYIAEHNLTDCDFRIDVITFYQGKLEHFPDAFRREE
ncbi:MAG: YraN family protein [candidate division Zixibacteria bacterium]|nr:YraN family protein [candidate division Zixibacteria bacterium]